MQVRFEEMGEQRKRFLAGYDRAVALLEQQRPAMVQSLDKGIAALGEDANSVLASLHSHAFVEATAEPPAVPSTDFTGLWARDRRVGFSYTPPADWPYNERAMALVAGFHETQNPQLDCEDPGPPKSTLGVPRSRSSTARSRK